MAPAISSKWSITALSTDMQFIGEAYELLKAAGLDNTSMRGVGWCAVL
jgi:hypothetical protein